MCKESRAKFSFLIFYCFSENCVGWPPEDRVGWINCFQVARIALLKIHTRLFNYCDIICNYTNYSVINKTNTVFVATINKTIYT